MKTVQYGLWKISVDLERTKQYYRSFQAPDTQANRNFVRYCEQLTSEEKDFFNSFGIDPVCCDIEHCGADKKGNFPCGGYYFICGKYLSYPPEERITIEELENSGFVDERTDSTVTIGCFEFDFQCEDHVIRNIPEDMPEGFLCIRFWCESMKWLLSEKPEELMYEPPRFWQVRKILKEQSDHKRQQLLDLEEAKSEFMRQFKYLNIQAIPFNKKEIRRYKRQWLNSFAPTGGDTKQIKKLCLNRHRYTPFLWHLFSFEFVKCETNENAQTAFDRAEKNLCVLLSNVHELAFRLVNSHRLTAEILEQFTDVTVTAEDFRWTYTKTHEEMCGPYFYKK